MAGTLYLQNYRDSVDANIADAANLLGAGADQYDEAIERALQVFSRDRPQRITADLTGDGTYDYTLPSAFTADFSRLIQVEHNVDSQTPNVVDSRYYMLYRNTSAVVLRFLDRSPESGDTLRIQYTAAHTLTLAASTVDDTDFDAVVELSCHFAALAMAAHYAQKQSRAMAAESINFGSKAEDWRRIAKTHRDNYDTAVIGRAGMRPAASAIANVDLVAKVTGAKRDFFFRRRRLR